MTITIKDNAFNHTFRYDDVTYLHLHTLKCKCGEVTLFKMRDKHGHSCSGQLDACDEMIIDNFVNI